MGKLLDSEIQSIDFQDDIDSFPLRTNFTNIKNRLNEVVDAQAAAAIGTTNAETTSARPYHTDLKTRLDAIGVPFDNIVTNGGVVIESAVPDLNVEVALTESVIAGIQNNTAAQALGPFVAPTNKRYIVICQNADNSYNGELGSDVADPVLPNIAVTQRPLFYFLMDSSTTTITNAMLVDCRSQGLTVDNLWFWQISDAVSTLNQGTATSEGYDLNIHRGTYIEEVDFTGYFNLRFNFEKGTYFKKVNGLTCFTSVNTLTFETTGNEIRGCTFIHDGTVTTEKIINVDFTDKFLIDDCIFTGTDDHFKINNSDGWNIKNSEFDFADIDDSDDWDIVDCLFANVDIDTCDGFKIIGCNATDIQADTSDNFIISDNILVSFDIGLSADCSKFRLNNNVIDDYSVTTTISTGSIGYLEDGHGKDDVIHCGSTAQLVEKLKKGWSVFTAAGTRFIKSNQTTAGGTGGASTHTHAAGSYAVSGTTGASGSNTRVTGAGAGTPDSGHGHSFSASVTGTSTAGSSEPPFIELIPVIHR